MDLPLRDAIASANALGIDGRNRALYYALLSIASDSGVIPRTRKGVLAQASGRTSSSIQSGIQDLIDATAIFGSLGVRDGYFDGAHIRVFRAQGEVHASATPPPAAEREVAFSGDPLE